MNKPRVLHLTTKYDACGIREYYNFQITAMPDFDHWNCLADADYVGAVDEQRYDLVHLQWAGGVFDHNRLIRARLRCRERQIPFLATYHNSADELVTFEPDRIFVHHADDSGEFFTRGYPLNKTILIHHGVPDLGRYRPYEEGVWGACGFLLPHKGFLELVQVFHFLTQDDPRHFRQLLLFCPFHPPNEARSEEYFRKIERYIADHDLGTRVILDTNFRSVDDLAVNLARARVIVYAYHDGACQPSSAALTLTYGLGRPAITSELPLFGSDMRGRLLFTPGDWEMLKRQMRVLTDDVVYKRLVLGSHEVAVERDWGKVGTRIADVYREMLDQGPSVAVKAAAARWKTRRSDPMKPSVCLVANGRIPYSFSHVNAQIAIALLKEDLARVRVVGLAKEHQLGLEVAEFGHPFYDCELRHTFPPRFDDWEDDGRLKSLFLSWETTHAPESWKYGCEKIDLIFVFSHFSKLALINIGVPEDKIKIIPLGVDHSIFTPKGESGVLKNVDTTVFLHVGAFDDRKGTMDLLSAYLDAFDEEDDTLLVLKNNKFDSYRSRVNDMINARVAKPDVTLIEDELSSRDLARLMRSCTIGVFPYRAEGGFGLPSLEILACGRPVAVSHFGAPTGHVNLACGWWLCGNVVPSEFRSDHHIENPQAKWFQPDHTKLVDFLRHVHENRQAVEEKAPHAIKSASFFTWEKTARMFVDAIREKIEARTS